MVARFRDDRQDLIEEEDAVEENAQHDSGDTCFADLDEPLIEDSVGFVDVLDHRECLQMIERADVHRAHPRHAQTGQEKGEHRGDRRIQIVVGASFFEVVFRLLDEATCYVVLQIHQNRVRDRGKDRRKNRPPGKHAVGHFAQQRLGVRAGLDRRLVPR